jgi:putative transposase
MKSIKIRLEFNNEQQTNALQHCGVARHAWNWGLSVCKAALERKEKCPSAIDLHKKLVAAVKMKIRGTMMYLNALLNKPCAT